MRWLAVVAVMTILVAGCASQKRSRLSEIDDPTCDSFFDRACMPKHATNMYTNPR